MILKTLILMLALVCSSSVVQAQDDQLQLRRRIIDLLNSTADEARKWDDKTVAARTQSQIADLIWDIDRENARGHLQAAWSSATKVEDPKRNRSAFVNPSLRNSVRREILLVARRRAPDLARTWLEEIVEETSAEKQERGTFDDRTA